MIRRLFRFIFPAPRPEPPQFCGHGYPEPCPVCRRYREAFAELERRDRNHEECN